MTQLLSSPTEVVVGRGMVARVLADGGAGNRAGRERVAGSEGRAQRGVTPGRVAVAASK